MNSAEMSATTGDLIVAAGGAKGITIEVIGFVIIVGILAKWIVPLVLRLMAGQQEKIAKQLADSEAASQKLAEAQAAYDNAVVEARAEAEKLKADALEQNRAIVADAAAAAQARADDITARAAEALEAERVSAVRSLQAEIATLAVDLAEQQVRAALQNDAVQRRINDRFLAELEGGSVGSANAPAAPQEQPTPTSGQGGLF